MQNILAQFVFVFFPVFLPGADLKITEPPERKTHKKKHEYAKHFSAFSLCVVCFSYCAFGFVFSHRLSKLLSIFS
jgi:hypothetical protein